MSKSRLELYREFLDFISQDMQRERQQINRRMILLLIWCFVMPALLTLSLLLLIKFHILPNHYRGFTEIMLTGFPVMYTLYVLSVEIIREFPNFLKKGGISTTLQTNYKEAEWRERTTEQMKKQFLQNREDWSWLEKSYEIDLFRFLSRHYFLTILSGVVFTLIFYGIGKLSDPADVTFVQHPTIGLIQFAADWSQTIVVVLFLVLFYLSGTQTHRAMMRYGDCLKLM